MYPQCYWVGFWIGEMCDVWLMDFSSTFSVYFVGALSNRDAAEQTGFCPPNHLSSYSSQDTWICPRTSPKNKGTLLFWATSSQTLMRWTREQLWTNNLRVILHPVTPTVQYCRTYLNISWSWQELEELLQICVAHQTVRNWEKLNVHY